MKRNFLTLCLSLFVLALLTATEASAQAASVRGAVKDADGQPLGGVSVVEKGTNNGTVSNADGGYALTVSPSAVLVFSFSGFIEQEVSVGTRSTINISLEADEKQLSEVVVTALGIQRNKKSLGYAMQSISGQELSLNKELNVANSLKGKIAGVHVNPSAGGASGSSFVVIRGGSSLTGTNQPLYVVDGVPIDNSTLGNPPVFGGQRDYGDGISNINPDDIETLSVLKGPAAAALYGARGANGVILITSKKGKTGRASVDLTSNTTFETPNVMPTFQNIWGGGYDDNYDSFEKTTIDGVEYDAWPDWLGDNWGGRMDGRMIVLPRWPELGGPVPFTPQPENNLKSFFRTGKTFTNTIAVNGGSERGTYRLSVSDMRNEGIVRNNSLNRQTINLMASLNVTSKLSVEAKINYVRQKGKNRPETGGLLTSPIATMLITPRFIDLDWMKDYKREDGTMIGLKPGHPANLYWLLNELVSEDQRDRVIGYVLAKYKFTDWLTLQARTGTDFFTEDRMNRIGINTPGDIDGSISNDQYHVKEENSDLLLTAAGKLSGNFTGSFSAGANHLRREQTQVGFTGIGFNIPNLYHIDNARTKQTRNYVTRKQMNSVYFAGQVGYKNFAFIDVTGRNDWSSTLGVNNYSFFYPSVSASFVFTDAFKLPAAINYGKVRVSYAEAGNDASPYMTTAGYFLSNLNFDGQPYASISSAVPLTDLKNELTQTFEIGTELRFWDSRVGVDFTYYSGSTKNQILPVGLSPATGYATRLINAGEIQNKGVEILLSVNPVRTRNFSWDFVLNLSKNRSKVVSLADGISTYRMLTTTRASIQATPGEPFGNIIGYDFLRNDEGQKVLTAQGRYQRAAETTILGNIQPDWLGGFTNNFSFKGITLSAMIDFRKGGQVYSQSWEEGGGKGTGKFTENRENLIADGVILGDDGKYHPSDIVIMAQEYYAQAGPWGNIATNAIIDADYAALREASLGYNIGASGWLNKSVFRGLRISVVGRNLFYLYRDPKFKLIGVSPETAFNTTLSAQGYEAKGIPTTRSIGINLSLSF